MEKQTAVEWFAIQLKRIGVTEELIGHLTKEAKEMEKQQIIDACEKMYSEEKVYNIVEQAIKNYGKNQLGFFDGGVSNPIYTNLKKWFDQFKKK
jgi:23S rRNA U2552 (ribose-2'-O)-methylase RlmE/FtsJ